MRHSIGLLRVGCNLVSEQQQQIYCVLIGNIIKKNILIFSSVQFSRSVVSDSMTPWTAACQASLSIANTRSLLKFMSIKSVMVIQ